MHHSSPSESRPARTPISLWRNRRLQDHSRAALAFLVAVSFVLVPDTSAQAVVVGVYELDGNVVNDPAVAGDDAVDIRSGTSAALATTVVNDPVNTSADVMFSSGGGSFTAKDTGDVSEWRWTNKEPGDKLDLIDVLASQYLDPTTSDPYIYIGATRYDGSGTSTLGFWFLQDPVELGPGGRFNSVGTGNPARHVDGDVLIVADFGGTNLLDIYRWSGTGPVLESTTTLSCLSATATTPACGVSNPSAIASPWTIEQKGYPSNQIGPDAFVELGVNLAATLGNDLGCYQSIVATSRTSDSITATLNDLAFAGVSTCDISITKSGPATAAAGATAAYTFEISNDGITPLRLVSLSDDVIGSIATQATAAGCDALRGGESCSFTVDYPIPAGQAAGPLVNTVTARYQPPNGRTTATATDSHTTQIYRPAVTVTKTADADPANVGTTVTYTYVISNETTEGSVAAPAMTITSIVDDRIGTIDASACGALPSGSSCTLTATDVPDGTADPLVNEVDVVAAWGSITRTGRASESIDVNRPPTAVDDGYTTDEDTVLVVAASGILSNDSDPDGDALSVRPVADTVGGDLTVGSDGSVTFDPAGAFESLAVGESTTVSFDYTAVDPGGLTATATVTITINGVNDPIDANPDSYTVDEGQTLTVPAAGVLGNDSDPDASDTLTVVAFDASSTAGGTVSVGADGSFVYDPAPGFTGTDTFTYTVSDGNGSSVSETVTITVAPAPDVAIGDATVTEGGDLEFAVSLSRTFSAPIDITFATSNGSATAGDDYSATSVTITFDPGDTSATVTVPTIDDSTDEPDETLILSVISSSTPIGDTTDTGTGTIVDDDAAPAIAISDASASEGNDLSFTITLSNPSAQDITIELDATDVEATAGSDYTAGPYSIAISAGATSGTLVIGSIEDDIDEPTETFTLSVASTSGGAVGDTTDTGTGTINDDDPAPTVTIGDATVTEGGDLSFAVNLSNPSSSSIVVTLTTNGVTAIAGDDYNGSAVEVTFLPGETSATAVVTTFEDLLDEPDETLTVGVAFVTGTVGDTSDIGTGTILDDDATPDLVIGDVSVTEGGALVFAVTLTGPSGGMITVDLATTDGSAVATDDYTATTGTVTFAPGVTTATFTVPTTGDLLDEPDETLTVSATGSTGTIGDTGDIGTGTILDDDATPDLVIGDVSVTEGGALVFAVTLTGPSGGTITVDLATTDGSAVAGDDYTATTGTVTFAPGVTTATFTVPTLDDLLDEFGETLTLSATASTGPIGGTSDTGTGTIIDDDATPDLVIGDVSVTEGGDLVFDVTLTGPSGGTITVDLTTTDGTALAGDDYTATTGTVTFAPGDVSETFTVVSLGDLIDEPDESLTLSAIGSTGTIGDTSDTGTGTIEDDDDSPAVSIDDVSVTEGGDLVFTVSLSNPSSSTIELDLRTADGTAVAGDDYTATTGTVTFDPGDVSKTFAVSSLGDLLDEPDETLTVSVDASTGPVGDTSDTGTGTILDDDATPDLVIGDVSVTEGGDLVFDVTLTGPSGGTITVDLATADGTAVAGDDYTATTGTVTFLPGVTAATFTVPTTGDLTDEPDETVTVSATGSTGTVGDTSDAGTGTIEDDDAAPTITIDDATIIEGGDLAFGMLLSNPSSGDIELTLVAADVLATAGIDFAAGPYTVTIPAGDTTATLTVSTIEDSIAEPDETFTLSIAGATGTVGDIGDTATGTITDDDADPDVLVGDATINEGGNLTFAITLTNPSANTITLDLTTANGTATAGDDYTATTGTITFLPGETSAVFTVPTTEDTVDEADETLSVSVTGSTGTSGSTSDTGVGTILDDDDAPDVVIGDASVTEGGDLVFAVTLANPSSSTITVDLETSDGSAVAGDDYTATVGTVTFAPGVTSASFTVPTTDDVMDESDETLIVSATGSTGPVGSIADTGLGTILDDDDAPDVVIGDASVTEGGALTFVISLSRPSASTITVDLETSDASAEAGTDYTATTGTVTFAPGVTTATFTVPTIDDTLDESDEALTVSATGSTGPVGSIADTGNGTIIDDEGTPIVAIGDVSVDEGGDLVFPVTLTGASGGIITIDVTTGDVSATAGADYTPVTTTVVFTPGSTSAIVTVPTVEDAIDEPDETLTLSITAFTGTVNGTDDTGTGTITDDDAAPTVTVDDASAPEGTGIEVTVTLSNPSWEVITLQIGTVDNTATTGDDYTAGPYTVTFPAGSTTATFDIPTVDDAFDEPDETIDLSILSVTAGTVGDATDTATATILDNDGPPTVTISDESVTEGNALVFTVTLSNPAQSTITVDLATSDGTATAGDDYSAATETVTFLAGETEQSFTVLTVSDATDEPDEDLTVAVTASSGPVGDTSDTGTGTILDDDDAPVLIIGDAADVEGNVLTFDVTLSNASSTDITVELTTSDVTATAGDDYTATTTRITFPAGATAATFTVATTTDPLDEPDETFTVSGTLVAGTAGDVSDTGIGTITDDDATPDVVIGDTTITEGGDLVFDVGLTAPSAATITVTVATSNGTATAPADFTATTVTITFNPGDTTATVTVPTAADTLAEADETLTLAVTGSTGTLGDTSDTGTGTITDDDAPDITVSDSTVTEGGDLEFTVGLTTTSSVDTVITLTTSDGTAIAGSDYTTTTNQITIPAGELSATFTVPTTADDIDESDESLTVSIVSVDAGYAADISDTGLGSILDDDDAPTVSIGDATTDEGDDARFTVTLSNPSSEDIVLTVTPATGTATAADVDLTPVTVTIPAGSTSVAFDVPTTEDTVDEPDETFTVAITSVVSGTVGDTSDTGIGTIVDDDATPTAGVSDATTTEGDDLTFAIVLSNPSSADITLAVATTDGTAVQPDDYTAVTTTVTIPAGSISSTVTVPTVEDSTAEASETMSLGVAGVVAGVVVDPTGESGIGTIVDDDAPAVTISDATATEGDAVGFTVTLSNASTTDTVLVLQPNSGTATGGSDFDADPITVTIPAGETSITASVPTVEDGVAEPTEAFSLAVDSVISGIVGDTSDTGTGTITDDDAPDVTIDDVTAAEGDALVFTVTLSSPTYEVIEVTLTPIDGSATGGVDYAAGTVTATFAPGDTTATATVAGIQDTVDESDETFTLSVTSSTGTLGDTSDTGTGTITDDDGAPSIAIGDTSVTEGGSLSFLVTLSNPSSTDITIVVDLTDVTATSGLDYTGGPVSVTIPAGATSASAVVATADDSIDEPTETLTASVGSTSGGPVGDISDTGTGSIVDNDDAPSITIGDAVADEGDTLTFTVTLSNASSEAITVTVATSDGTATDGADYSGGSFDVTFAAGATSGTVTVPTIEDTDDEPDETLSLSVTATSGGAVGSTADVGTGTIVDDDLPTFPNVSIGDASVTEGGDLVFPITLDIPAIDTVQLEISTADGSAIAGADYTATTSTVTIAAGASSASFTVPTTDDSDPEPTETMTATIGSFSGSVVVADGNATGTIIDDDAVVPDVVIGDVTVSEGDTATFTVSLTAPAVDDVTITISTTDGTATAGADYTSTTVVVTILAGQTSTTFDVPTTEDPVDEPDETFSIAITSTTGTLGDTSDTATGTIADDDGAPAVTIGDASATEGDDLVFAVNLTNPSTESITVTVGTTDGTATGGVDYGGGSFDVTFAPGDTSASVTVSSNADSDVESNETFTLGVTSTTGGAVSDTSDVGTGTIVDDDAAPTPDVSIGDASVTEGGDLSFTVTLSVATTADVTLTLTTSDDTADASDYTPTTAAVTIAAGDTAATFTVPTTSDTIDEPDETLTVSVVSVDAGSVGDISDTGTGTILDDDAAPSLTLDDVTVTEGGDAVFSINLSNPSSQDIVITLGITGGTADDSDRPNITVTVTIPAGATTASATFPTTADTLDEPDETFIVGVVSVDAGTVDDTSDTGTATILDDDGVLGSITGRVWEDADSDVAIDPGETDISGVTVELYQSGPDSTFGTADDVLVDSSVTASPYLFSDLDLGTYQVRVVVATLPTGYVATGDFDGGADSTAEVTVVSAIPVTGVDFGYVDPNDPPIAADDAATAVGPVTITVLGNDSDPDSDPLTVDSVVQPANGTVVVNADGTVTYTPDAGFAGSDTFTYTVCDPTGACDTATVSVTVSLVTGGTPPPGNNPPDYETGFVPELVTVVGGTLSPLPLVDPDGDNVTVTIVSGTLPLGVTLDPNGTLVGSAGVSGTFELELELCDDGAPVACVLRPLTIVVDQIVGNTPQPPLTPQSPAPETPATEPPGPIDLAELPFTGLDAHGLLALALALLGAGAVLLRVGRSEP